MANTAGSQDLSALVGQSAAFGTVRYYGFTTSEGTIKFCGLSVSMPELVQIKRFPFYADYIENRILKYFVKVA